MTAGAKPRFMSHEHVATMNALLEHDPDVGAAARSFDRAYRVAFRLTDAPGGGDALWEMRFDPAGGVRFALGGPVATARMS